MKFLLSKSNLLLAILLFLGLSFYAQNKKEIPVLCYHAIQNVNVNDSKNKKTYSVTPEAFAHQMKALAENGYKTISPDELYNYLTKNEPLPKKPIMITFDDGKVEQYNIAVKEMNKYHFKGVFFIMTVAIGKPGYMSTTQIKTLANEDHTIGSHTWDHHKISEYGAKDWKLQLVKPKKLLEKITNKPVNYFAYPYGVWNQKTADSLKCNGFKLAFCVYGKGDPKRPLFTIRRMIVPSTFTSTNLIDGIKRTFKN